MDTYSLLREIADSWVLLMMFAFFIGAAVWAFWPGQRAARDDAASIPFRNDVANGSDRTAYAEFDKEPSNG
ncbi:MAG: cbb3-type cytochrome c oxidase subunit 3 [Paracoccaceae bacterium]